MPGCCLRPAPCAPAATTSSSTSTARSTRATSTPRSPVTRLSTGRWWSQTRAPTAVQAVVTTVAAPDAAAAGRRRRLHHRAHLLQRWTAARRTSPRSTQNERFVVVLTVTENNAWPSRVLVTDLLPAGFEIDNPGLVSSADLANFDWLPGTSAAHLEFRDDRFIAAFDRDQVATRALHARLCGARGDAGRLRASGGERRGHVPSAIFGAHRDGHDGGQGAVRRRLARTVVMMPLTASASPSRRRGEGRRGDAAALLSPKRGEGQR